jgi:alkanesulfonate monooxygenase SsuD/methylene tetrahydromethanopterin reductase-like flavin-dependent oxidoreductase (luciferase family)
LLARLAADSGDLILGTNILILPLHKVVEIAEQYATLDIITGGRLILGISLGFRDVEYRAFGVERASRAKLFEEQIEALKLLWTEDDVDFGGRHVRLERLSIRPKPLQRPRPLIWIGGEAEAAIRRAAVMGDAWIASPTATFATLVEQAAVYREARAVAGLGSGRMVRSVELCIGPTREAAFDLAAPYIANKYKAYAAWGVGQSSFDEFDPGSLEDIVRDRFIIGSPTDCLRACLRHRDELGIEDLLVRMNFPGMPNQIFTAALRLFAEECLPHLRG